MRPTSAHPCSKSARSGMTLIEVLLALFILMLVSVSVSRALITVLSLETQSRYQFEMATVLSTLLHDQIQWGGAQKNSLTVEGWEIAEGEAELGRFIEIFPVANPRISASLAISRPVMERNIQIVE